MLLSFVHTRVATFTTFGDTFECSDVVTSDPRSRLQDILIACVDDLKGFPEAIESVYPRTRVQGCSVHLVRHSLNYVSWKQRRPVAAALKGIYSRATREEAELALDAWGRRGADASSKPRPSCMARETRPRGPTSAGGSRLTAAGALRRPGAR